MRPLFTIFLLFATFLSATTFAGESIVLFTPPKNWKSVDTKNLPPSVKFMVVGDQKKHFPPSMNLGCEEFAGDLKSYLKAVKEINKNSGAEWLDLGTIDTKLGKASLSQADSDSEWGMVRMMHVICVRKGNAYVLTAASLKADFPKYRELFFEAMKSLELKEE